MLTVLTAASGAVLTTPEAKAHLRVMIDDDDDLIDDYVATATELCEGAIARSFLPTEWRLTGDGFPGQGRWVDGRIVPDDARFLERNLVASGSPIVLPRAPVASVDAVTYLDASGARVTLDPSAYTYEPGDGSKIYPAVGRTWPSARVAPGSVRVDFTAGYPDAASVPRKVRQAVRITTFYLYENRGAEAEIPDAAMSLLSACGWGYCP